MKRSKLLLGLLAVTYCLTSTLVYSSEVIVIHGNLTDEQRQSELEAYNLRLAKSEALVAGEIKRAHELDIEAKKAEVLGQLQMLGASETNVYTSAYASAKNFNKQNVTTKVTQSNENDA